MKKRFCFFGILIIRLAYFGFNQTIKAPQYQFEQKISLEQFKQALELINNDVDPSERENFQPLFDAIKTGQYTDYELFENKDDQRMKITLINSDNQNNQEFELSQDDFDLLEAATTKIYGTRRNIKIDKDPVKKDDQPHQNQQNNTSKQPAVLNQTKNEQVTQKKETPKSDQSKTPYLSAQDIEEIKKPQNSKPRFEPSKQKNTIEAPQKRMYTIPRRYHQPYRNPTRNPLQPKSVGGSKGNQIAYTKEKPFKKLKDVTEQQRASIIPKGITRVTRPLQDMNTDIEQKIIIPDKQTVNHERKTERKSKLQVKKFKKVTVEKQEKKEPVSWVGWIRSKIKTIINKVWKSA